MTMPPLRPRTEMDRLMNDTCDICGAPYAQDALAQDGSDLLGCDECCVTYELGNPNPHPVVGVIELGIELDSLPSNDDPPF